MVSSSLGPSTAERKKQKEKSMTIVTDVAAISPGDCALIISIASRFSDS